MQLYAVKPCVGVFPPVGLMVNLLSEEKPVDLIGLIALGGIALLILLVIFLFKQIGDLKSQVAADDEQALLHQIGARVTDVAQQAVQRETAMRDEFRANREETAKSVGTLGETVRKIGVDQTAQQTQFRDEIGEALKYLNETVRKLGADQSNQQQQFRDKLDEKMKELRDENSQKQDEMRKTVDEKLQSTLEKRLSESFKTVSERLEAVQKGLGEMQNLASGVGDLKRVLTNVKSRGTFGEVQLELLIDDFLTADQYIANYDCGHKVGTKRVEFGIRMPGGEERYLPVDAKFPTEDYERLLLAVEAGDKAAMTAASDALVRRIKSFAKDISQKYINPPHTTSEALLFVPTEGLYAEVLRAPGLIESLQRDFSVTVTGPTNFQVLLSTFRMGYQQAVMQEQAAEVWKVLGAVKKEFARYGEQIEAMTKNVRAMGKHVEKLETRKNMMERALKTVEVIDSETADKLIEG